MDANACSSEYDKVKDGDAVVVCGSPGEVGNGDSKQNVFRFNGVGYIKAKSIEDLERQKSNVWSMIALESSDQLRQRTAWALSQILAISPNQVSNTCNHVNIQQQEIAIQIMTHLPLSFEKINESANTEMYLNYYDIFVRHAFGNYFDILKEVAYSPMMSEMLSFLDSKSSSHVLEVTGNKAFPDENFAREIMQLFTIGVNKLHIDGTLVLASNGDPILTYDNSDIQNFARAWTGFTRLPQRGNIEGTETDPNRIDPMRIQGQWYVQYRPFISPFTAE
jgi:hypothetical protein